jgi:hypothetical protein
LKKLLFAISFALLVLAGMACGQNSELKNTTAKITYPEENAKVAINEIVEGNSNNIAEGYKLWIIVYPRSVNRYYFQDFKPNFMANGEWSASAVIGNELSAGQKFDVYAALANNKADEFIVNDLKDCSEKQSWPGLKELPEGTTLMDKVTVIRG